MRYHLTNHAKKRCIRRKIQLDWIQRALENPLRIEDDVDDPTLVHVLWAVPDQGFRLLRVIYNEQTNPISIVTAYFENEIVIP